MRQILSVRMLMTLLMGYAAGLPLLLIGSTLQAWMTDAGVDLTTIGAASLLGLPYSFKFVWAPLLDRFQLWPGRRRGWMWVAQAALVVLLLGLSTLNPQMDLWLMGVLSLGIAFFSATQDIMIDAYRREILGDDEQALGYSLYVVGYRLGLLVAGAGALWLADTMKTPEGLADWSGVYRLMASCMVAGLLITILAPKEIAGDSAPKNLQDAVIGPFKEFFKRKGAWSVIAFILLYKVGDTMAANMTTPFMLKIGYSKTDIASVAKTFGLFALIAGGISGGILTMKLGTLRSLWIFGFLQAASTAGFCWLNMAPISLTTLGLVIGFENLCAGLGSSAYGAFMAMMTDKRFTATQYALLTALMAVPRSILSSPTGWLSEQMGWTAFFLMCTVIALPGMLLIKGLSNPEHHVGHT